MAFRKNYANNDDPKIIRALFSYFNAVKETFTDENGNSLWELSDSGKVSNVLQTNVGYQALLKVLFHLFSKIPEDDRDKKDKYKDYLKKAIGLDFIDSGEEKRYPYTSKTINVLYDDIIAKIL